MPFGSSSIKGKPDTTTDTKSKPNIFFDTKQGVRDFRIVPGDEVLFRRVFMARESNGHWVPTFGYIKDDPREKKPVICAVFNPALGDNGQWIYDGEYDNDPIRNWVANADVDDATRKTMYVKSYFAMNVLDRTRVKITEDGTIVYPDARSKYPVGMENNLARMRNEIVIFQGSAGKSRDEDGNVVGKHLYAELLRTVEGQVDVEGNAIPPTAYDIRLTTTGRDIDTQRRFSLTGGREDIDWSQYKRFDLQSWLKPWPYDAIQALMDGAAYMDIVQEYQIKLYPDPVDIVDEALF